MSYYTYYKLKEDSKYKDTTIRECESHIKSNGDDNKDKALFYASMVQAYYETNINSKYNMITFAVLSLIYNDKYNGDYYYLKQLLEDENKELWRNHAPSQWDLEENINKFEDRVNHIVNDLMILSCIKFEPDERYSDTSKTVMDYLSYEYINKLNDEIEILEDLSSDYSFAKFVVNECDSETEGERYNKEHPEENE